MDKFIKVGVASSEVNPTIRLGFALVVIIVILVAYVRTISSSIPFTDDLDSFCTAMASTQPSHISPSGLRLAKPLSEGISEMLTHC